MSITEHKHVSEDGSDVSRRLEIFTGAGRRRSWSVGEKAAIVAESYAGVTSVCDVARRHALTPSQLFTWRREARLPSDTPETSMFVEAVVGPAGKPAPVHTRTRKDEGSRFEGGLIEVEIDGVTVRVGRGADGKTIAAVLRALKGAL